MIVYNITCKVRWAILEAWLTWQIGEQLPLVLGTGLFTEHRFFRLLEQDEDEGPTFVLQYLTTSLEQYRQFNIEFAPAMEQAAWGKWGDSYIAFRTLMESVE